MHLLQGGAQASQMFVAGFGHVPTRGQLLAVTQVLAAVFKNVPVEQLVQVPTAPRQVLQPEHGLQTF